MAWAVNIPLTVILYAGSVSVRKNGDLFDTSTFFLLLPILPRFNHQRHFLEIASLAVTRMLGVRVRGK